MKKLFLIFLSLFCISCSSFNPYVDQKTRDELFRKGTFELMTEEEKQNLYAGGTASVVVYKAANYIYQYQDKIIVSDNTYAIQEAIEYMGQSENGRKTLKNCRFLFLNHADREKIAKLAKEYGFKYSYPKVD